MIHPTLASLCERIVRAVLDAADPQNAVQAALLPNDFAPGPTHILATGKAAAPMVDAALQKFGSCVLGGIITCVPEHESRIAACTGAHPGHWQIFPVDHPLPTERNLTAAHAIEAFARERTHADRVLALISGGASAHLTSPAPGLTLHDLRKTTDTLLKTGATIGQLNTVRKHLERLKGGQLASLLNPARTHALILSDVLGDPLDTIGSGPLAPDPTTFSDASAILKRLPETSIPPPVLAHIQRGVEGTIDETPKPGSEVFRQTTTSVIANNNVARTSAITALTEAGFPVHHTREAVQGEAAEVAQELVAALRNTQRPAAVVFGGETTVTVGNAPGKGGRNQELALAAAIHLADIPNAAVLTLATDGIDGPTDAAGGVVTDQTVHQLRAKGRSAAEFLRAHDSYHALDAVGALIRTGPTGTNINDIAVAILFENL